MKIKQYGKTVSYNGPQVRGPSGEKLNIYGVFIANIKLGLKTEINESKMIIIEDLQNSIIIGASTLTLIRKHLGLYMGKIWHHPDWQRKGNDPISEQCPSSCQDCKNSLVLNPSDRNCFDIVDMVDDGENFSTMNKISETADEIQVFDKFISPIKKRFVSTKYVEIDPHSVKFVPVISQKETWNNQKSSFDWIENEKRNNSLLICEPSGKSISIANMNVDRNSIIVRENTPCYPVFNYSDDTFCIHKNAELAEIFSISPGKKLRAQDIENLKSYDELNMKNTIDKKAKDGISFPRNSKYKVKFRRSETAVLTSFMVKKNSFLDLQAILELFRSCWDIVFSLKGQLLAAISE